MPYKLLLADDSVTIQRVIELTFADEDIKVTAVGDGQQAIDRIRADRPHIVLADVGMPRRDGYEVAAFIKDDPELAHIPVLLLTGAFEPVDEERARAARCNGVLAKPFEPQLLIARVKELLGGTPKPAEVAVPTGEGSPMDALDSQPLQNDSETPGEALTAAPPAPPAPTAPSWEDDATVPLPRFAGTAIGDDLKLDTASLELRPAPAAPADGTLDDYFDRLDAAFAHLTGNASAQAGRPVAGARPVQAPAGPAVLAQEDASLRRDVSVAQPEAGAPQATVADIDALATRLAVPVSDAFASLLGAERQQGPGAAASAPPAAAVVLPGTVVTDRFVADVARRVFELVGEPALRGVIAEVVSTTAERLIREEIDRIKASVK